MIVIFHKNIRLNLIEKCSLSDFNLSKSEFGIFKK